MTEKLKITRGNGNVFLDIGFSKAEAENLKLRAELMTRIEDFYRKSKMTQGAAARDLLSQTHGGSVKAYAVAAGRRLQSAPSIPTVDEAGWPGLHVSAWFGFWAPKGTPKDVIGKLNASIVDALADPAVRQRLEGDLNLEVPPADQQTPEGLGAYQRAEIRKWWPIIKATNIKAE
jgi:tripartite-type tricarboxylate transporter receptor subunit TctC